MAFGHPVFVSLKSKALEKKYLYLVLPPYKD